MSAIERLMCVIFVQSAEAKLSDNLKICKNSQFTQKSFS